MRGDLVGVVCAARRLLAWGVVPGPEAAGGDQVGVAARIDGSLEMQRARLTHVSLRAREPAVLHRALKIVGVAKGVGVVRATDDGRPGPVEWLVGGREA